MQRQEEGEAQVQSREGSMPLSEDADMTPMKGAEPEAEAGVVGDLRAPSSDSLVATVAETERVGVGWGERRLGLVGGLPPVRFGRLRELSDIRRDAVLLGLMLLGVLLPRLDCHGGIMEGENRPSEFDDCLSWGREDWKMALCRFLRVERRARLTLPAPDERRFLSSGEVLSPPVVSLASP